jgi:gamma-glutamyltranspeptidase/glutathione hydrolase
MGPTPAIVTADDFGGNAMKTREPLVTTYRGYAIVGFPPPSSGGVHVAQILACSSDFDHRGAMAEGRPGDAPVH